MRTRASSDLLHFAFFVLAFCLQQGRGIEGREDLRKNRKTEKHGILDKKDAREVRNKDTRKTAQRLAGWEMSVPLTQKLKRSEPI